jgi:transcriptional regulator with XRE-family HTH domain
MIKNDRQYKITKNQLKTFDEALRELKNISGDHAMIDLQKSALESQRDELSAEILEYELLREGKSFNFSLSGLEDLPRGLIKARITLGLTQKDLADRLNLKEQQVQRWEANDYAGASIGNLQQVVSALGIEMRDEIFVPNPKMTGSVFLKNLSSLGISKDLLLNRILPPSVAHAVAGKGQLKELLQAAGYASRVFGAQISELLSPEAPVLNWRAAAGARFKMPARSSPAIVSAYTVYAHYLALLVESCAVTSRTSEIPTDWADLHEKLSKPGRPMTFKEVLRHLWDCGFVILPLRDSGAFHGAVWKIRNHYVIILKQKTALESRWLFDLLHELAHVALGHVTDDVGVLEEQPISAANHGDDEDQASEWAEDVIFNGESEAIETECTRASKGHLRGLKAAIVNVAQTFNVNLGALANHMAFRLGTQGTDWWGNANNLQTGSDDPFDEARTELLRRVDLRQLNEIDRELLIRALSEEES